MEKKKRFFFWKKSNIGESRLIFSNKNELYWHYNLSKYVLRDNKLIIRPLYMYIYLFRRHNLAIPEEISEKNCIFFFCQKYQTNEPWPISDNKNELYCYYNLSIYVMRQYKLSYIHSEHFRSHLVNWEYM